jgi:hypothetical protein
VRLLFAKARVRTIGRRLELYQDTVPHFTSRYCSESVDHQRFVPASVLFTRTGMLPTWPRLVALPSYVRITFPEKAEARTYFLCPILCHVGT